MLGRIMCECQLQAILASSADGEGLDVELAASGFGKQHQEVLHISLPSASTHCQPHHALLHTDVHLSTRCLACALYAISKLLKSVLL